MKGKNTMNAEEEPAETAAEGTTGQDKGGRQERRDDRTRGKLREVEAERDVLRGRVDVLVEAEVHRLLADRVADVDAALRIGDRAPASFVNADSGLVDAEAITGFVTDLTARMPALTKYRPLPT